MKSLLSSVWWLAIVQRYRPTNVQPEHTNTRSVFNVSISERGKYVTFQQAHESYIN